MGVNVKFHPDNLFLVAGYVDEPGKISPVIVAAPNKTDALHLSMTAGDGVFKPVSITSLRELHEVVEMLDAVSIGELEPEDRVLVDKRMV